MPYELTAMASANSLLKKLHLGQPRTPVSAAYIADRLQIDNEEIADSLAAVFNGSPDEVMSAFLHIRSWVAETADQEHLQAAEIMDHWRDDLTDNTRYEL